jgi:hypothetical protein
MKDIEKSLQPWRFGVIVVQDQGLVVAAQHLLGPWVRQPLKPCDLKMNKFGQE